MLQRSLLATLAFFDVFDHPLTFAELRRLRFRLPGETDTDGVPAAADALAALAMPQVGVRHGYYFLQGRDRIVGTRARRYRLAEQKFVKARRMAKLFGLLPSVRLVAVCNSLAISNADEDSDIDLFIICRPGALWLTRLAIVGFLQAFGLRPTKERQADTFCASFFVSENAIDLSRFALKPADTYLRYWIASLVPLHDAGGAMDSFLAANAWVRDRLPGVRIPAAKASPAPGRPAALEALARRLQRGRFPREIASMANKDTRVVITDDVLKFHINDRRKHFEDQFRKRLRTLGIAQETAVKAAAHAI